MPILTITAGEAARAAGLDASLPANTDAAAEVIADEQDAIECLIDPAAFALADISALLRRNVAKLLAAELWEQRSRAEGASGSIGADGVAIGGVPDAAARLRAEARAALGPYLRKAALLGAPGPSAAITPDGESAVSPARQRKLFGPTEGERGERA